MAMVSKIRLSYHRRLFLVLLTFSWTIILCSIFFQYFREKQYKKEVLSSQLQLYNWQLIETIEEGTSYEAYISEHRKPFDNLRISIISFSGNVIYDNTLPAPSLNNHRERPEIVSAMKSGSGYHIGRQSESDGKEYFYSATKGDYFLVRTAIPYSASLQELLRADWTFIAIMILISLLLSVLAYFFTRSLGKNIDRLNRFAEKAEKGESFDEDEPFPNDELSSISNHIVKLYGRWQQTIKDRDTAHEAAMREEQEKIRIKRQLTNNINHELKTPVASMQVCLETLLSGINLSEEKQRDLLERCYVNNQRLRRLLEEVSLITRMEDGGQQIQKESILINAIINEIAEELEIMPEEDRMNLHTNLEQKVYVHGNMALICSIFRNLTENAISYSGGKNINILLIEDSDEHCRIRFEDDGRGVEEEQLTRIFERFYRLDKGRSRQKGGTGLGLAIVKHAVQFHGGTITASIGKSGGLCFDFILKKQIIQTD